MAMGEYFPADLIREVLLRLPVKSLLRFKSVSKTWSYEITTPSFYKSHITNKSLASKIVMESYNKVCIADIDSGDALVFDTKFPLSLQGSYNGLLCFIADFPDKILIIVCNILINDYCYIKLPEDVCLLLDKSGELHTQTARSLSYGFGYDSINDDYKVVLINSDYSMEERVIHTAAWIYSLRKQSWKQIEIDLPTIVRREGVFFRRSLHWLGVSYGNKNDHKYLHYRIISIDIEKEMVYEVPLPEPEGTRYYYYHQLGVYKGCLSIGYEPNIVWIMKDYMVKESWTKFCTFPCSTLGRGLIGNVRRNEDDRSFLLQRQGLAPYLYDSEKKKKYELEIYGFPWIHEYLESVVIQEYIETLVSVSDYEKAAKLCNEESSQREVVSEDSHLSLIQKTRRRKVRLKPLSENGDITFHSSETEKLLA